MLRLMPGEMTEKICLATYDTLRMGQLLPAAVTPCGPTHLRGFPFFDFFREIFHR
jgi:hypothetical protein